MMTRRTGTPDGALGSAGASTWSTAVGDSAAGDGAAGVGVWTAGAATAGAGAAAAASTGGAAGAGLAACGAATTGGVLAGATATGGRAMTGPTGGLVALAGAGGGMTMFACGRGCGASWVRLPPFVKCARTLSAWSVSMELEWVFPVTPIASSASRIGLLFTSSSRARSLIRTLLIRPFSLPCALSCSYQPHGGLNLYCKCYP